MAYRKKSFSRRGRKSFGRRRKTKRHSRYFVSRGGTRI